MFDQEIVDIFVEEGTDYLNEWERVCLDLSKESSTLKEDLESLFRCAHNLKGASKTLGFVHYGDVVHQVEDLITHIQENPSTISSSMVDFLIDMQSYLLDALQILGRNDDELRQKCEVVKTHIQHLILSKEVQVPLVAESKPTDSNQDKKSKPMKKNETIRLSSKKLDQLIQMVGELSINQSIVSKMIQNESIGAPCTAAIQRTEKISKEIQEISMSLRMNTLETLFQRLKRTSMDIAKGMGKDILISVRGEECELDRSAIECLTEPLIHIVRNAVDHGIESPEKRQKLGKQARSELCISAKNSAEGVEISITDNGSGLSTEKIRQKAIVHKLISEKDPLKEEQIHQLIFRSGFSTAEKVSDISGRGVGLDVVRSSIEQVNGSVFVKTEEDKGTTFLVHVPVNINILETVHVMSSGQEFILPLNEVQEIVTINSEDKNQEFLSENTFSLRSEFLPYTAMSHLLGTREDRASMSAAIILKGHRGLMALGVERILRQGSVFMKNINSLPHASNRFISGATITQNGKPGSIVNIKSVIEEMERRGVA